MPTTIREYVLNDVNEPPDWSARERQLFEDIIDKLPDNDETYVNDQHFHGVLVVPDTETERVICSAGAVEINNADLNVDQNADVTGTVTGRGVYVGGSNNELRFYEGANYVGFEAPALGADQIWVLPNADGNANEALGTDAAGNLIWRTHDELSGFVANEHIDHTAVTLTAGDGLTGGGDISSNRTFAVGAGVGITVNANDVAIDTTDLSDNYIPFWDNGNTRFGDSPMQTNGTNVGIGVAPTEMLHLESATTSTILVKETGDSNPALLFDANRTSTDTAIANIVGRWDGTDVCSIVFTAGDDTGNKDDGYIVFNVGAGGSLSAAMRIEQNGDIGINTDAPVKKTEIVGDDGAEGAGAGHGGDAVLVVRQNTNSTTACSIDVVAGTEDEARINFGDKDAMKGRIAFGNDSEYMAFDVNSERMRIDSAGAIQFNAYGAGILHSDASGNITSSGLIGTDMSGFTEDKIAVGTAAGGLESASTLDWDETRFQLDFGTGNNGYIQLIKGATTGSTSTDGSIIGLGVDANNDLSIWNYENSDIVFATNNDEKMRIDNAGAIQFNAYGAGILHSDGSGNITSSTVDISADTNLAANTGLALSGDTVQIDTTDLSDNYIPFWDNGNSRFGDSGIYWDGTNVGIGTESMDGLVHIMNGSAGTVTAPAGATDVVVESNGDVGMSFLTQDANYARIVFGSPTAAQGATIAYSEDNEFSIGSSTGIDVRLYASGDVIFGSNGTTNTILLDGSDSGGTAWNSASAGNFRHVLVDEDGYLHIGTTNVAQNHS